MAATGPVSESPAAVLEVPPAVRITYPFSLIPGGVHSDTEFEAARIADKQLEQHYSDVGFLRPVTITQDRFMYASYRRGKAILWTKKAVLVKAGELVFGDRSGNLIRGRCGNRLSDTPRQPVSEFEPPELIADRPTIEFPAPPELTPAPLGDPYMPLGDPQEPGPSDDPSPGCADSILDPGCAVEQAKVTSVPLIKSEKNPDPDPPHTDLTDPPSSGAIFWEPGAAVATPEPGSFFLLLAGCGVIFVAVRRRRTATRI
jgi:hypothetical protein